MKHKKMFIISFIVVIILFIGFTMVYASNIVRTSNSFDAGDSAEILPPPEVTGVNVFIPADEADDYIDEQYRLQGLENPLKRREAEETSQGPSQMPFYNLHYAKADAQQREKLDKIMCDTSLGSVGTWTRDVLITMGELPEDMPRLTLEYVEKFIEQDFKIKSSNDKDVMDNFNKIAGAPDWEGGSGMYRAVYYLDDERSEAILVMMGGIIHVPAEGQEPSKIINGPEITAEPSPSSARKN